MLVAAEAGPTRREQSARARVRQVVGNWTDAVFALLELLPGHPSLPQLKAHAALGGRRVNPGGSRTLEHRVGSGGRSPLAPAGKDAGGQGSGGGGGGGGGVSASRAAGSLLGFESGHPGMPLAMGGLAVVSFVAGAVLSQSRVCAVLRVGRSPRRRLPG